MKLLGLALAAVLVLGAAPADASPRWTVCDGSCSFDVPPGDYEIEALLTGQTGLDVEARRIAVAPVSTRPGRYVHRSVTVEVRTPEGMPSGEDGPGTPGLQVRLTGTAPQPARIAVTPRPRAPRIFVISDSTASDWTYLPKNGWAQALPSFFRAGPSVRNYAQSGASTVSYLADPRYFPRVRPMIRPGDTALIQLAHNDKQTTENVYRANLATLVDGVRAQGGAPVLVTPPVRHRFGADGKLTPLGLVVSNIGVDLPAVMRDVARQQRIPLLDLTARSRAMVESLGEAASWPLYLTLAHDGVDDATHLSRYGAEQFAARGEPARYRFGRALELAAEAGNDNLVANIRYRLGRLHLHHHDVPGALAEFAAGRAAAQRSGSPRALAILTANEAWAHAMDGDERAALTRLAAAEAAFATADAWPEPAPWEAFFREADMAAMRGTVLTELATAVATRYSGEAVTQLTSAADRYGADMARSRSLTLIMLAQNHALRGDFDEATRIGEEAVELAGKVGSVRPKDRLVTLERLLREHRGDEAARGLADRIRRYRAEPLI